MVTTTTTAEVALVDTGRKRDTSGRRIIPSEERQELVRAYGQSGLTQRAFAEQEGISYSTFTAWLQGRRRAAESKARSAKNSVQFAEVRLPLPQSARDPRASDLEVRLPDGTMLRGSSVTELAKLVRALRT